jgi:hypothetical protein
MQFMISRFCFRSAVTAALLGFALLTGACSKVPLLAPSGSTIILTSASTALPVNGTADIIAQVLEAAGTPPQDGTLVTFTTTLGTIQPSQAETSGGRVIVKFNAGSASGTATIVATSGGASVGAAGAVKILVGTAAVGRVIVSANPTLVPALGGSTTISAVIIDVNGNPLSGAPVSFSTTAGSLADAFVPADQNGVATTTLRTSTTATVTASVGAQGTTTPPATGGTTPPATGTTAGQASATVTVGIASAPTLVITPPTAAITSGLPATFTFVVTAAATNGSAVRDLTVTWGDGHTQDLGAITGTATVSHVYAAPGNYVVTGTVIDSSGNPVNASTSVTVIQPALSLVITPPSSLPGANLPAAFTVAATAPAGDVVRDVTINWGDGSGVQDLGAISGTVTVSHVYKTAGNYLISGTVADIAGNTSSVATSVTVVATPAPTIIITVQSITPTSGHPATVTFQLQVTAPPGVGIQDAVIDWGDGSAPQDLGGLSGTITLTHTYQAAGQDSVKLQVTDTLGRTTTGSTSVTIS